MNSPELKRFTSDGADKHALVLRLCRLMCGKASPFRQVNKTILEAAPQIRGVASINNQETPSERQSLSADQAAEPRLRQSVQNLIDPLRRQILVIIKIQLKHGGRAAR